MLVAVDLRINDLQPVLFGMTIHFLKNFVRNLIEQLF